MLVRSWARTLRRQAGCRGNLPCQSSFLNYAENERRDRRAGILKQFTEPEDRTTQPNALSAQTAYHVIGVFR
jgi:hypothetical protein